MTKQSLIMYLDGKYLKASPTLLDTFTPGRQQLKGVFETMRVYGIEVELLDAHLTRLFKGLKILKIKPAYSANAFKRIITALVRKNPSVVIGRLRLMVFVEGSDIHCAAMILPYKLPGVKQYKTGLKLTVIKTGRVPSAKYADVKSLDYGLFAGAYQQALAAGFDDVLLLNKRGFLCESSRANVFIVHEGKIFTPPLSSGCLNGVVRGEVMAAARRLGMPVFEKNISVPMLQKAEQIYLTNSLLGIIKTHSLLAPDGLSRYN